MRSPRERFDYAPMTGRAPLRLPDGAWLAVVTVVNVEEWEIGRPMPRGVLPPPGGAAGVPNWAWHQPINSSRNEDAVLFSVSDSPVLRALGLYWEEPENSLNVLAPPFVPAVSSSS